MGDKTLRVVEDAVSSAERASEHDPRSFGERFVEVLRQRGLTITRRMCDECTADAVCRDAETGRAYCDCCCSHSGGCERFDHGAEPRKGTVG